jgi:uncharacterized membrane protein
VIAGTLPIDGIFDAVIWTESVTRAIVRTASMFAIGGMAASGLPIVGTRQIDSDTQVGFRWTNTSGIANIPAPSERSSAADVSADGVVIVGDYTDEFGLIRAFRWRLAEPLEELGLTYLSGSVAATNHDGSIVVANSEEGAWIWTLESGPQLIHDVLSELGVELDGWNLHVNDISTDGHTLVGSVVPKNESQSVPWVARLP